jgi:16S rRNA (cytosine967-C5)-methyltransferase
MISTYFRCHCVYRSCNPEGVISPARRVAFDVLKRVEVDDAFASDALGAASEDVKASDAGLAEELTFGVLRFQAQIDFLIGFYSGKLVHRLDPEVRIALRMGIYQLRYLDRVPTYAAVGESVELVKWARKRSAAGMVNAVLRKVTREPVQWPDRATELSMPKWLLDRWDTEFGPDIAAGIAWAALRRPDTYVRMPEERPGLVLEPAEVPGSFRVISGDARGLRVQDIGSQSIVPLLDLRAGQRFLDLCSAPGNKTAHALESGVSAIACDVHLHRLKKMSGCARVVLDASGPLPFRREFERILVDAPCSGTGTLARNPEIKWKLRAGDVEELHAKQVLILRQAIDAMGSPGRLVYSTCSLERQENEDVVAEAIGPGNGRMRVHSTHRRTPGIDAGDGFFAAILVSD